MVDDQSQLASGSSSQAGQRWWHWVPLGAGALVLLLWFGNGRATAPSERSFLFFVWQESGEDKLMFILLLGGAIMALDCFVPAIERVKGWLLKNRPLMSEAEAQRWSRVNENPLPWSWIGVVVGLATYVLAWRTREPSAGWLAALWTFWSATLATRGGNLGRRLLPAVIVMFMGVPALLGEMVMPLQIATANSVAFLFNSAGIALKQRFLILELPNGTSVEVAAVCSGIRSVSSLVFFGMVMAHFDLYPRVRSVLAILVSMVFLGVAANIFRAGSIVAVSLVFGSQAGHRWHEGALSGLLPVVLALAALLLIVRKLQRWEAGGKA